jgi:SAM-dependent methyltransferase
MGRRERMLAGLDLTKGAGLEIGALCRPLVCKSQGDVYYVDYADAAFLRQRYADDPTVDVDQIVEVDFLWGEQPLREITGGRAFDYIIASHVIEHVPDLITWLDELRSVLKPGGTIRLAIPDRRYSFDYLRRESRFVDALDAYLRRARRPLPIAILDHLLNTAHVDCAEAWRKPPDPQKLEPIHSFAQALDCAQGELDSSVYHDVHCWVFTPSSFVDLLEEMSRHDLLRLSCERLTPTDPNQLEFFVSLRHSRDREDAVASWQSARAELASRSGSDRHQTTNARSAYSGAGRLIRLLKARETPVARLFLAVRDSARSRGGIIPMLLTAPRRIRQEGVQAQWAKIRAHWAGVSQQRTAHQKSDDSA